MHNFKRFLIYSILFVLVTNVVLFDLVYANSASSKNMCGVGYSYNKQEERCVCIVKPTDSGVCDRPGYGLTDDGCCIYSCSVCSSTSNYLQQYINFQVELLQILRDDVREQDEQTTTIQKAGLFGTIFLFPKNIINYIRATIKNGVKKFRTKLKFNRSNTVISSKLNTSKINNMSKSVLGKLGNILDGVTILFRSKPYVRDWGKLLDIDLVLADVTWDLTQDGYWSKNLSQKFLNEVNIVRTKYSKDNLNMSTIFEQWNFIGDVRYQDIVLMMKQINSFMMSFISTYSTSKDGIVFLGYAQNFEKSLSSERIQIVFNTKYLEELFKEYKCAQGGACNSGFEEIKKVFRFMPAIKQGFSDTVSIIKKANKEFLEAFSKKKDRKNDSNKFGLTDKQIELLRTVYGIDTSKLTTQQGIFVHTFVNRDLNNTIKNSISFNPKDMFNLENTLFKKEGVRLSSQIQNDDNFRNTEITQLSTEDKEQYEKLANYLNQDKDSNINSLYISLEDELNNILNLVIGAKHQNQYVTLLYDQVSSNVYFLEISKLISNLIDEFIGTKNSDGLIKNLGEVCSIQCANKGNENCYFK